MDAPTGRYKIVERDRRLVTIDTRTGQEIGLGGSVSAPPSSTKAMPLPQVSAPQPVSEPSPMTQEVARDAVNPWQRTAHERSFDRAERGATPQTSQLQVGRFIVRTAPSFDSKGPRSVTLSIVGVFWWVITHHWRVLATVLVAAFLFSWLFFLFPILLISGARQALLIPFRSSLTNLFDAGDQAADG